MSGPIAGTRIMDLTQLLPGAYCTTLLGDLGAEVIKVERPGGGDFGRSIPPWVKEESAYFLMLNRNKKSIVLDLKSDRGREAFFKLARTADVVLENFRPGVVDRLGIGYSMTREVNPGIIYCSISGYGQEGEYRNKPGHDLNYIGLAGLLSLTGERGGPPVIPGLPVADLIGATLMATVGVLAALCARERTGKGQYIDLAMFDGVIWSLPVAAFRYFAEGKVPGRGEDWICGGWPCYNVYETKDGKYVTLAAFEEHFWADFCRRVGRPDLIEYHWAEGPEREEVFAFLKSLFLSKTQEEWIRDMEDLCVGPIKDLGEALSQPLVKDRGMVVEIQHPTEGPVKQFATPIRFTETPTEIKLPPPRYGEHTAEILEELGYGQNEIEEFLQWLEPAGPVGGRG